MARFTEEDKKHFPLRSTDAVVALFREHLEDRKEPNLTLLSVVLGALENSLTSNRGQTSRDRSGSQKVDTDVSAEPEPPISSLPSVSKLNKRCSTGLPALQLSVVEALYEHFVTIVKGSVDLSSHTEKYSSTSLVKKVSDVIWEALTRTFYKDRAHLQTVFTLLTGQQFITWGHEKNTLVMYRTVLHDLSGLALLAIRRTTQIDSRFAWMLSLNYGTFVPRNFHSCAIRLMINSEKNYYNAVYKKN